MNPSTGAAVQQNAQGGWVDAATGAEVDPAVAAEAQAASEAPAAEAAAAEAKAAEAKAAEEKKAAEIKAAAATAAIKANVKDAVAKAWESR
ncbi:hypothetical protein [Paenarthrobacter sp. C1]|uniref:hypothetical protein n=1 Tax=Paenarthrobacter sp. C1 TaxID=3400220 RepID=UPI003BF47DE8